MSVGYQGDEISGSRGCPFFGGDDLCHQPIGHFRKSKISENGWNINQLGNNVPLSAILHDPLKRLDIETFRDYIRYILNYRNDNLEKMAGMFKALAHPNRLRIFLRLISCCVPGTVHRIDGEESTYVGDLGRDLGIVPSTVSHHIKELRRAGLIRMERRGQKIECWVDPEVLKELAGFFSV